MKRARDVREQLLGLMDRVEVELVSNPGDHDAVCREAAGQSGLEPLRRAVADRSAGPHQAT